MPFDTLLASVKPRPVSTGRPLAPTGLPDGEKRKDLLGLFSKYNLEYRRPYPQHRNIAGMDVWKTLVEAPCDSPFTSEDFRVELRDFSGTQIWDQADWFAWEKAKSSMIVPMKDGASAVGDFGRTVVTTSFHALCWLLGDFHTADEIEEAWERMPLVKMARGKDKYRGVNGARSSRSWSSQSWWG